MKEEFKNRWLELLIFTVLGIYFTVSSFVEGSSVDTRIHYSFIGGACLATIVDFISRNLTKLTLKAFNKLEE